MSKIGPDNPLGLLAIDHLEFTADSLATPTRELFFKMGFSKTLENREEHGELFEQGQVRFLLTANPSETAPSRRYFKAHGEGVSKISFLVKDTSHALAEAGRRGARVIRDVEEEESPHGLYRTGIIQGVGDILNEFVQRPKTFFRPRFTQGQQNQQGRQEEHPLSTRLARIDHLTNNVPRGDLDKWEKFYKDIYGFKTTRYFDIKGKKTGLESKVLQLANGIIIIPINEPAEIDGKSQIQEFLDLHHGPGVQHIALSTPHIIDTVADLRTRGIKFLSIPHTYYQDIPNRNFTVEEDVAVLEERQLLVDGDPQGYLIQNFTDTYIGPLFFEIIQRKKHFGFGEGNFQALFDAIERDQVERGYLK